MENYYEAQSKMSPASNYDRETEVREPSLFERELGILSETSGKCRNLLESLENRLQGVLRQDSLKGSVGTPTPTIEPLTPHVEAIRKERYYLEGAALKINSILSRLEL